MMREPGRDAHHPPTPPANRLRRLRAQHLPHERLELVPRRLQPRQVRDRLRQHPAVGALLELDHHRGAVLVQPQRVDPPSMPRTRRVLRRQKPDNQHPLQTGLHPPLQLHLQCHRRAGQLDIPSVGILPKQHQVSHQRPLPRSVQGRESKGSDAYSGMRGETRLGGGQRAFALGGWCPGANSADELGCVSGRHDGGYRTPGCAGRCELPEAGLSSAKAS